MAVKRSLNNVTMIVEELRTLDKMEASDSVILLEGGGAFPLCPCELFLLLEGLQDSDPPKVNEILRGLDERSVVLVLFVSQRP